MTKQPIRKPLTPLLKEGQEFSTRLVFWPAQSDSTISHARCSTETEAVEAAVRLVRDAMSLGFRNLAVEVTIVGRNPLQ